jgi:hypothetical protein
MTDSKSKIKPKSRPYKKFYCDRDETFLLPANAFKVWMFYYRLEGAKREGWATREMVCEKCDLSLDTFKTAKAWLVQHGWLKQVGWHRTRNGYVPMMQVTRGTIPAEPDGRGLSNKSKVRQFQRRKVSTDHPAESFHQPTRRKNSTPPKDTRRKNPSDYPAESFRADVDTSDVDEKTNPDVDGVSSGKNLEPLPDGYRWDDGKIVKVGAR